GWGTQRRQQKIRIHRRERPPAQAGSCCRDLRSEYLRGFRRNYRKGRDRGASRCRSTGRTARHRIPIMMILLALLLSVSLSQEPAPAVRAQFDSGNYKGAQGALTAALKNSPNDASLHYWLGRTDYELRNYDDAVSQIELAVRLAPENAEYYRWLGRAYGAKAEESHSFFLARKVKQAFEAAVNLAPRSIEARRDLMQYLVEASWIVGGDKEKAKKQIDSISQLDPVEGRLAHSAYLATEKKWDEAGVQYLAAVAASPSNIDPYVEAAQFFAERKDAVNLNRVLNHPTAVKSHDPRLEFYRAVLFILSRT